jgi:peptidoglycan biosynthesis protein MviN/MurJ (putative lipid II flippase)
MNRPRRRSALAAVTHRLSSTSERGAIFVLVASRKFFDFIYGVVCIKPSSVLLHTVLNTQTAQAEAHVNSRQRNSEE